MTGSETERRHGQHGLEQPKQGPARGAREDQREGQAAGPPTVLVVDDDPVVVALLAEALAARGYRVLAALGAQALRLAREARPAVVLLDLQMPQMDGAEVCRRLRAEPATAAIPIILISADERPGTATGALAVDDRLPKPFDLNDLLAAVDRWAG
jgi:CheY-like chemotaxis protein